MIDGGRVPPADTVIHVETLLPSHSYSYYLTRLSGSGALEARDTLIFTTMDTTGNNFTWQFDTLAGQGGASYLSDIAVIDDSTAYAVGDLFVYDSVGQVQPTEYNLVKWNGTKWTLQNIEFDNNGRIAEASLSTIFSCNSNDIWVGGSDALHWDGKSWGQTLLTAGSFNGRITRFWGTSFTDVYAVGTNGAIAHLLRGWQSIGSGTTMDFADLWGTTDSSTGVQTVYAIASAGISGGTNLLLQLSNVSAAAVSDSGLQGNVDGIWFPKNGYAYVVGGGIYRKFGIGSTQPWTPVNLGFAPDSSFKIRGQNINDIFVAGSNGMILHFNGVSWTNFKPVTGLAGGAYYSVAIDNNLVVAVGLLNQQAIIAIGRRQ
jgi:hypothetical protein